MNLSKDKALQSNLYHFRIVALVRLDERLHEVTEDGESLEPPQGYYRSYGVTASTMAEAARLVEDELWKHQPTGGPTDPLGSLEELEVTLVDPEDVDLEGDTWKTVAGIHWVSGRAYFAETDEEEQDDD
jgi:hypothetical protein